MYCETVSRVCAECNTFFTMTEYNGKYEERVWCCDCTKKLKEAEELEQLRVKKEALDELKSMTFEERLGIIEEELYNLRTKSNVVVERKRSSFLDVY